MAKRESILPHSAEIRRFICENKMESFFPTIAAPRARESTSASNDLGLRVLVQVILRGFDGFSIRQDGSNGVVKFRTVF